MIETGTMVWLLLWIVWWSICDLRSRVIYLWQAVLVLVAGVVFQVMEGVLLSSEILGGVCLGMGAVLFSRVTRDGFGMGDGLVILCLGVYHGFGMTLAVATAGLMAASVVGLVLLLFGQGGRKQTLPLIPFLLIAYLWVLLMGGYIE